MDIDVPSSLKIAWLVGVLRSKILLSKRVSWLTLILRPSSSSSVTLRDASSIWSGKTGSDWDTTQICLTWSSTSFWVHPSIFSGLFLTWACTSTILSLGMLKKKYPVLEITFSSWRICLCNEKYSLRDELDHLFAYIFTDIGDTLNSELLLTEDKETLFP